LVAAGLFLRMEQARGVPGWLLHYGERAVDERLFARGAIQGILYTPRAGGTAPGLVLAHGIHDEGIHEARLVRLARSIASSGRVVFTPELTNLSHYRITHADAETIAQAARTLAEELGQARVAVFGISFGGGLALRAACEPALGQAIARVIALGAHHDAAQVARFFLGETARAPDGSTATLKPHGYGGTVLFAWLFGEKHRGPLSAADVARVRTALDTRQADLAAASPAHCREAPRVPVHLAHGVADNIVPYTETLANAAQFGRHAPLDALISPVLGHAEYAPPTLWQRFQLVDFMARALPRHAP
jgi:pimeloyl-ACP methyl ester carboxylesterase